MYVFVCARISECDGVLPSVCGGVVGVSDGVCFCVCGRARVWECVSVDYIGVYLMMLTSYGNDGVRSRRRKNTK